MIGFRMLKSGCLLILLLAAGVQSAQALCSAEARGLQSGRRVQPFTAQVDADFDGDSKPDVAIGSTSGPSYTIEIRLSSQSAKTYLTLANGGVGTRIFAFDVDKDSYQDLIVTSAASLLPIAVYLGDGKGHFQAGSPWAFLPFLFDSPYRYDQGKAVGSILCLMPPTRFTIDRATASASTIHLQASDYVSADSPKLRWQCFEERRHLRGPPSSRYSS
jgi:hypothetical protein